MSALFKRVCKILKIKKINTSAYHPQANLVERSNRELKTYLRQYVMKNPQVWDYHLPYFQFFYNTVVNGSTNYSPHELLYGRAARLPTSVYAPGANLSYEDYTSEMRAIFRDIHKKARENLILSKEKRKLIYDKSAKEWQPSWGDLVLLQRDVLGTGKKLQNQWHGPYEVQERPSEQTAVIMKDGKFERVHVNRLKRFHD